MALFNDPTQIDSSRFNRQDLRYGFGIIFGDAANPFLVGSEKAKLGSIPNPKVLVLNPQSITQDEPFAVNITPTQDGGLVIENRGHILKNITVTGTTGFLPLQARIGLGGVPIGALSELSGYKDFLELRNLFKIYGRIKRSEPDIADQIKMVFLNGKDNESWIVEPQSFRMNRAVPRKTLYNYNIPMVAVANFDTERKQLDFIDRPSDVTKTLQSISDAAFASEDFARGLEAAASIFAGDVAKAVVEILSPLTAFTNAANSVLTGVDAIVNIIPTTVNQTTVAILNFLEVADSAPIILPVSITESSLFTLHRLNNVQVRLDAFRSTFPTRWDAVKSRWQSFNETMENRTRGQVRRSAMTAVRQETVYTGDTIQRFTQRVTGDASRFMDVVVLNKLRPPYLVDDKENRPTGTAAPGDALLVPINPSIEFSDSPISISLEGTRPSPTLKSITTAGTPTTLVDTTQKFVINQWAGFTVEIVSGTGTGQSRFVESNTIDTLTVSPVWATDPDVTSEYRVFLDVIQSKQVDGAEKVYGVDLQLARDYDLIATPESDVALIRGIPNLAQAIDIKFDVEQGELPLHPGFGFNAGVGSKGILERVLSVKVFATKTFLRDSRIERVEEIDVELKDSKLSIVSKIKPKNTAPKFVDLTLPG